MDCLNATSARAAFDCLSRICVLYPAHPFRGKSLPKGLRVPEELYSPGTFDEERESMQICAARPYQRASRKMIRQHCRDCQPEDRTDCGASDCALYPYRPWPGPGHAPKREATDAQKGAAARARAVRAQKGTNACLEGQLAAKGGRT
jgi:hypothetical protein